MNKTVNINIGGLFFHIDEDAFQKLSRYFDAIKRSLSNSSGKDEIMKDIEMRVAELFTERQKSDKHVINLKDVDEVVSVMGQPEDYRIDDDSDNTTSSSYANFTGSKRRKLYRDKDNGLIAGVCTGLGHYFGIDSIWIKILFLIFVFAGFGTGILAYFILWVITPIAVTTTEKLEMTGEPINISNIEKKVREEFENVSNKFKGVDYDKMGNEIRTNTKDIGNKLGNAASSIFGAFAKVLGAMIMVFAGMSFFAIAIASIVLMFSSTLPENTIINNFITPLGLETPLWQQGLLFLFAAGIPVFFLLYLGLKLLVTNLKSIGNVAKYSLLALWIISMGFLTTLAINKVGMLAFEGKDVKKEIINITPNDTLYVKFKNNDYYTKNVKEYKDIWLTQDENNHTVIYSNKVSIEVFKTDEAQPYIQVERISRGKSPIEAKERAQKIKYGYKIVGNQIILDNYILTQYGNVFRNQEVEIFLYLPKGMIIKPDANFKNYDDSDDSFFNLHHSGEYTYKVEDSKIVCLNCPANEQDDYNDVEINTVIENDSTSTIQLNEDGILIKKSKNNEEEIKSGDVKSVTVDKNGVTIKTK
jgi:phage shock protein PspC (stress-responsive transcriptional regulator)